MNVFNNMEMISLYSASLETSYLTSYPILVSSGIGISTMGGYLGREEKVFHIYIYICI